MPGITEFPSIIVEAVKRFSSLFKNESQRNHFAEYLTGLMIAERKTINGITQEFADSKDQSCLNRFLTEVSWDEDDLNQARLKMLQDNPLTRYSKDGTIAIDNVLIDHDGKFIKDVGWFWDHSEQRNKIAHDYLFANYVCKSGKHYPLDFKRFKKKEQCDATGEDFVNHTDLCISLVDWVCENNIPGDFTFDSYFTSAKVLNHINSQSNERQESRAYVGDLKSNRKIRWHGKLIGVSDFAETISKDNRKEFENPFGNRQWYFTVTTTIPEIDHRVRLVIIWDSKNDSKPRKIIVSNRTNWEITRITGIYRNRWTGTETFHRDGKQELGMGDCQLRDGRGQTRHMHLVMLAYSLLITELDSNRSLKWSLTMPTTIGEACRSIMKELMRKTIAWVVESIKNEEESLASALIKLRLA